MGLEWDVPQIPKIAHFYWGNKTLPFVRWASVASFANLNPDWDVRLHRPSIFPEGNGRWFYMEAANWDENSIPDYWGWVDKYPNITVVESDVPDSENVLSQVCRSDYLRLLLLRDHGGVWSDIDVAYIRAMKDCYLNYHSLKRYFQVILCYQQYLSTHQIGFLAARPGDEVFIKLAEEAPKRSASGTGQHMGSELLNELYGEREMAKRGEAMHNLKPSSLYGVHWAATECLLLPIRGHIYDVGPEYAFGIHWFGGSPPIHAFIKNITHENYEAMNLYITEAIKLGLRT